MATSTYYKPTEVFSKDELKRAVENKSPAIEIKGELQEEIMDKILHDRAAATTLGKDALGLTVSSLVISIGGTVLNPFLGGALAVYGLVKGAKTLKGVIKTDTKQINTFKYSCFYHPTNEFLLLNSKFSYKKDVLQGKEMYVFYDKKCSNCNCAIADYKQNINSRDFPELCPKCGKKVYYKLG